MRLQSRLNEVDIIQPALFAIQVALAALWRSWGIEPQAVVGHSMGEVAAAYVAGALSLEDAVRVICHRSRLVRRAIGQGAMAAVELSMEEARGVLDGYEDRVSIAASNSPTSTVLSGDPAALEAILDQLRRRDIFCAHGESGFRFPQPADGSLARRFVAGSGRPGAATRIRAHLLDCDRHGQLTGSSSRLSIGRGT